MNNHKIVRLGRPLFSDILHDGEDGYVDLTLNIDLKIDRFIYESIKKATLVLYKGNRVYNGSIIRPVVGRQNVYRIFKTSPSEMLGECSEIPTYAWSSRSKDLLYYKVNPNSESCAKLNRSEFLWCNNSIFQKENSLYDHQSKQQLFKFKKVYTDE